MCCALLKDYSWKNPFWCFTLMIARGNSTRSNQQPEPLPLFLCRCQKIASRAKPFLIGHNHSGSRNVFYWLILLIGGSETETVQDIFADIILSPVTQHYNTWTSKILIFLKFGDPNQQMAACGDRATFCFEHLCLIRAH